MFTRRVFLERNKHIYCFYFQVSIWVWVKIQMAAERHVHFTNVDWIRFNINVIHFINIRWAVCLMSDEVNTQYPNMLLTRCLRSARRKGSQINFALSHLKKPVGPHWRRGAAYYSALTPSNKASSLSAWGGGLESPPPPVTYQSNVCLFIQSVSHHLFTGVKTHICQPVSNRSEWMSEIKAE